uniref:Uncharacterized protein n=1 Tax=Oryctolagus cuniculus TaxID=9986 RepID=A0A5F9DK32_RABIT
MQMQVMGPVQRGLPLLSALPQGWPIIIIDIKDCFFSIPLHTKDCERFAFTLPACNHEQPDQRYEWVVLPQGMANSPTMCQLFVGQAIGPLRKRFSSLKCIHYMDDILLAAKDEFVLDDGFAYLIQLLESKKLFIAPEKVQKGSIATYLGSCITSTQIVPQKVELRKDSLKTLNDFQRLLGDINWVRGYLNLPNYELKPLYVILRGDSALDSPRCLTPEAREALEKVEKKLQEAFLCRMNENLPLSLCILPTLSQPTGLVWQEGPLLWIHPRSSPAKSIEYYPAAVAKLALEGLQQCLQYFGKLPCEVIVPYDAKQVNVLCALLDDWAVFRCGFPGFIDNHLPKSPLLQFFKEHPVVFPKITAAEPLLGAPNIFTDGSKTGCGVYMVEGNDPVFHQFQPGSPQVVELKIVIEVLKQCSFAFNLLSDSLYVVNALKILETAGPIKPSSPIASLLHIAQQLLWSRKNPFFAQHIRAHTGMPGPLCEGNARVDLCTRQEFIFFTTSAEAAKAFHQSFHVNACALQQKFHLSRADARQIVLDCADCAVTRAQPSVGVNPRGLLPGRVWQMDVTHVSEFGKLKYVHVSVDTCSGIMYASPLSGESTRQVIAHCLDAWAAWGKPQVLKTDNGPAYTSQTFTTYCQKMEVQLVHGLPYNPQGQGIIERAHRTLKEYLLKQKGGVGYSRTPRERIALVLFTINFLNLDVHGHSAADRHQQQGNPSRGLVKWKDLLTGQWRGPDPVLAWARGAVCVFPQDQHDPVWVPERAVRRVCYEENPAVAFDTSASNAADTGGAEMGDSISIPKADAELVRGI